jgi:Cof subfamily protein (haloacid dehalogenase superfamily)
VIRVVASDLDGTLLRSDLTVSERTRSAIHEARRAGVTFVAVTGRPPRSVRYLNRRLGLEGIAICANGAAIYDLDGDVTLDTSELAPEVALRVVRGLREAAPGVAFAWEDDESFGREPGWGRDPMGPAGDASLGDPLELIRTPLLKVLARHDRLDFDELAARARRVAGDHAVVTWSTREVVEVSAAGVTKAAALARVCQRLGVDSSEVIAIGDMPNDLSMLAWAGHSVAVANADPEVRTAAAEVTASNQDDGVAMILERVLASEAAGVPAVPGLPAGVPAVPAVPGVPDATPEPDRVVERPDPLERLLERQASAAVEIGERFQHRWGPFQRHPALEIDPETLAVAWREYAKRLDDNYPYFHPRFAGQMLKPPHPVAVAAYLAAMIINPNNHALDGGPATAAMEKELIRELAAMFHLPADTLGHLTSSGTIANLEALWVARQLHPGKAVAFSEDAHYTHERMCGVLGVETVSIPADHAGRMDLDALERELRGGRVGTVVLTAGTTGLGALDPVHEAVRLRERYGFRLHVDAAYGGFFALLAWAVDPMVAPEPLRAIADCDSVVVDPHKHGLQPYGCGAVLFRDPAVGRLYRHDSPYTYFTSDELHLGEISLECSRAGAAAGALWLTLRVLPLEADRGLGPALAAGVRAARAWAGMLEGTEELGLFLEPDLDIVGFYPRPAARSLSAVDAASERLLREGMRDADPVFLSTLRIAGERLRWRDPTLEPDLDQVHILRSVLMKPEHELYVPDLHRQVTRFAARALRGD